MLVKEDKMTIIKITMPSGTVWNFGSRSDLTESEVKEAEYLLTLWLVESGLEEIPSSQHMGMLQDMAEAATARKRASLGMEEPSF